MRPRMTRYAAACAGLVVVLALVVGLNSLGTFHTDIKPEVYLAPWETLGRYASGWTASPYLGSANFNVGLLPVLVVVGVLRSIGLDPEWAFKVFHFGLWLCAGWGANRFLRALVPSASKWAGLVAGVAYVASPYQMQAGTTLAILLPLALLPWMLLTYIRALQSPRGWAWPAAFGLIFFGMSGMNVAVVPIFQLTALIPLMIYARMEWGTRAADIARATAKCALFVVGLSLYWLAPARAAMGTGRQIVLQSETLDGIAKVSSFPEVLRGMGLWPLYGSDSNGPWTPQLAVFLISTWVMLLTMLWPTFSVLALRWMPRAARFAVIGWIGIAAVFMVGMFPGPGSPASPFGMLLREILSSSAASAFRTTNKIGAVLALGFAVALGMGAQHIARRLRDRDGALGIAIPVVAVLIAGWTLPAFTGRLYTSPMEIPAYWQQAAAAVDKGDPNSRVLLLPGQVRPTYRWTPQRPDDVPNSLFTRDAVIPETSPNASAPGGNYLAALDDALQEGGATDDAISTYARYLGADQVLVRHDTVWEQDGGARPAAVERVISADSGLFGQANFGRAGEFVFAPGTDAYANGEGVMSPLQLYDVRDPVHALRASTDSRSLVVAGDGWSVRQLAAQGLLNGTPSFRYASSMTPAALANQLGGRHVLVLTDTNARRAAIPNRLTNGEGALLSANESAPNMRSLGSADDQTVVVRSGATVRASAQGGTFFDLPFASPENLLDGDASTAWMFGDFGRATGQYAVITQPAPVSLGTIRIKQASIGSQHIDKVTVTAGGRSITKALPDADYANFEFGSLRADTVTIRIDSTRGDGYSMVGISDVQMPGALAVRTARTPLSYQRLYQGLSAADRQRFGQTPLNVTLSRVQGTTNTSDDAETELRRIVTLPDARTFKPSATVRVRGDVQTMYDTIAGYPSNVRATSSDFYFHEANARASMAADGDSKTAWVPGGSVEGAWWQLVGPQRSISKVTLDQQRGFGDDNPTQWADRAVISVDGVQVAQAGLKRGAKTTITFPAVRGKTVRVTLLAAPGAANASPPRFTTIDTGLTMKPEQPGPTDGGGSTTARCQTVATVDGKPVRMRPAKSLASATEQGTDWIACGTVQLGAGEHRIEQAPGFTLDTMALTDKQYRVFPKPTDPVVKITKNNSAAKAMTVRSAGAFNVIIGQSFDQRWVATANGKPLGKPTLIDGYSTGWRIPQGGRYDIDIRFAPQRASNIAAVVSSIVVVVAVGLIIAGIVGVKRRTRDDPDDDNDDDDSDQESSESGVVPASSSDQSAGSGETDDGSEPVSRREPVARWVKEIGLIAVAGFAVGIAGLLAAVAVVIVLRTRVLSPRRLLFVGAGLIFLAMPVYLLVIGDKRGTVSADAVSVSMWPHYLAGAGLVIALSAALLIGESNSDRREDPQP